MKSKDEILKELNDIIVGYLNEKTIWSHFSNYSRTTRGGYTRIILQKAIIELPLKIFVKE